MRISILGAKNKEIPRRRGAGKVGRRLSGGAEG
jgi:hypothetical protein